MSTCIPLCRSARVRAALTGGLILSFGLIAPAFASTYRFVVAQERQSDGTVAIWVANDTASNQNGEEKAALNYQSSAGNGSVDGIKNSSYASGQVTEQHYDGGTIVGTATAAPNWKIVVPADVVTAGYGYELFTKNEWGNPYGWTWYKFDSSHPRILVGGHPAYSVNAAGTVEMTASAEGNPAPSIQWQVSSDGVTFSDITNATSVPYRFPATADVQGKYYRAVFRNTTDKGPGVSYTRAVQLDVITDLAAGGPVQSSPTAYNGKVYFGGNDGKLHGYTTDGQAVSGFPFDTRDTNNGADASATRAIQGRPALRVAGGSLALFFATDDGWVFRVPLDSNGTRAASGGWAYRPDAIITQATTAPAVANVGGTDFVYLSANTSGGATLYKFPAASPAAESTTSFPFGSGTTVTSSPAVYMNGVYIGVAGVGASQSGMYRLNASSLTVLTGLAPGQSVSSSPYISHTTGFFQSIPVGYIATDSGRIYAVNTDNGSALESFGTTHGSEQYAEIAAGVRLTHPYLFNNRLYLSGYANDKAYEVDAQTGASSAIYTAAGNIEGGVAVDPQGSGLSGTLSFGDTSGAFHQVSLASGHSANVYSGAGAAFRTTPTIDLSTGRTIIGNDGNKALSYPRY